MMALKNKIFVFYGNFPLAPETVQQLIKNNTGISEATVDFIVSDGILGKSAAQVTDLVDIIQQMVTNGDG